MEKNEMTARITTDPLVMTGKPTVRGLRITVEQILTALAAGLTPQDLLDDYPELEMEDISACLIYATELVSETREYAVPG